MKKNVLKRKFGVKYVKNILAIPRSRFFMLGHFYFAGLTGV